MVVLCVCCFATFEGVVRVVVLSVAGTCPEECAMVGYCVCILVMCAARIFGTHSKLAANAVVCCAALAWLSLLQVNHSPTGLIKISAKCIHQEGKTVLKRTLPTTTTTNQPAVLLQRQLQQ